MSYHLAYIDGSIAIAKGGPFIGPPSVALALLSEQELVACETMMRITTAAWSYLSLVERATALKFYQTATGDRSGPTEPDQTASSAWEEAIARTFGAASVIIIKVGSEWHFGRFLSIECKDVETNGGDADYYLVEIVSNSGECRNKRDFLRERHMCSALSDEPIYFLSREEAANFLVDNLRCKQAGAYYAPQPPPGVAHERRVRTMLRIVTLE